jgi:branched-chain amino acid transport system substrate-binding protein
VSLQAKQLRDQGVTCALVGGVGWDTLINNAGDEALNGFWSSNFDPDTGDPKGAAFVQAFRARFSRPASQFAALGYDAMALVADGIMAAGSFKPVAVKVAIALIDGTYVTGNIRFDADRNPVRNATILEIMRVDGKLTNVYNTTVNPK